MEDAGRAVRKATVDRGACDPLRRRAPLFPGAVITSTVGVLFVFVAKTRCIRHRAVASSGPARPTSIPWCPCEPNAAPLIPGERGWGSTCALNCHPLLPLGRGTVSRLCAPRKVAALRCPAVALSQIPRHREDGDAGLWLVPSEMGQSNNRLHVGTETSDDRRRPSRK